MRIKTILPFAVTLAISIWLSAYAAEQPKPATPQPAAPPAEVGEEAKAQANYEAAEKAARDAEAAVVPLLDALRKADAAYGAATTAARAKQQQAADAKNLAGERGAESLKQAEAAVPVAVQALADATKAKPELEKALADAQAAAIPLRQAYEAAEKAAREAEGAARAASDAAKKLDGEAREAAVQAAAMRRTVDVAKTALVRAQQSERQASERANAAAKALTEAPAEKKADAEAQKKAADEALAAVKSQVAEAAAVVAAAEKTAQDFAKIAEDKKSAAAQAAAKRKAAADAAAALAKAQQAEQQAQAQANAAAKALADAPAEKKADAETQKKAADAALANAKSQVAAAAAANQAAQEAAKELLQLDAAAKQAAEQAAAKRKELAAAAAALDPAQKALEQATLKAGEGVQKLAASEARKKSAEDALESLKKRIEAAKQSHVADEEAAKAAEAAAVPLKAEADKARQAYTAAKTTADEKRAQAAQAKAKLYQLIAARKMPAILERPEPPKPANGIDERVFAKLKTLGIQPVLCSDAVFIRRVYLDLTGKLPSGDEAKAFIQNPDPNKRTALIDRLLEQYAHVDYWAMRWGDVLRIKAEFPVKVWPNAAQAYHRWVWESIAQNKPYDQFARELLTSSGSNFRVGPVNFYRAIQDKTPEGIAASVALAFMGRRVQSFPPDRLAGVAVLFTQVGYKPTSEWKEEIVFWDPLHSTAVPGSTAPGIDAIPLSVTTTNQIPQALAEPLSPNAPLEAVFPDGTKVTVPPTRDPREVFAEWLIRPENPWFAKAIVNRTWAWVMGRGIIHEPDDIRDDNPPSNPELLAYLEKELVSSGWDLKHLKRLIFTSTTYQFSSIVRSDKPEATANFASYPLRRVEAEVLIDAVNRITGSSDLYTSAVPEPFTYIPKDVPAVALADGSVTDTFLTLFGRSARATGTESERVNELSSRQWIHMLNSGQIQSKLQTGPKLKALISAGGAPNEIIERLYLAILSRLPTEDDVKAAEQHAKAGVAKGNDLWIDLAWALINNPEFLLRH